MTGKRVRLGGNYRKLYLSTAVSNIGDGMASIAYPWLATAITRNPLLIALVVAAQRLPWLVFTLPAGVITDRVDRKKAMVAMDSLRFVFTLLIAVAVFTQQDVLPKPDAVQSVVGTRTGLYLLLLVATVLLGSAEVLRDNAGQTFMPSIVAPEHLERANGRMWSIETVANTFIGPPLGSLLLVTAFSVPFFVDAGSFFAAAALVAAIPGTFRVTRPEAESSEPRPSWTVELKEGFRWLWSHPLLRSMAIILGFMNLASNLSGAVFLLFSQDVLGVTPLTFTLMGFRFRLRRHRWRLRSAVDVAPLRQRHLFGHHVGSRWRHGVIGGVVVVVADGGGSRGHRHPAGQHLECHHRQPSPDHHSRPPTGPCEQRLPLLRLGNDSHRRIARWSGGAGVVAVRQP